VRSDPDFYNKATVDKYGRKISKEEGKKAIDRLYEVDSEDDEEGEEEEELQPTKQKRDKAVAKELARVQKSGFDPIRDGGLESSSDESSDEDDVEIEDETELAGDDNAVPTGDISSRLAAVNMDWDNMRAIDILGVANSFVPPGGRILNVVIYPSEFGMERLQREEIEGPPREIFASSSKSKDDVDALDDMPEPSDSEDEEPSKTPKLGKSSIPPLCEATNSTDYGTTMPSLPARQQTSLNRSTTISTVESTSQARISSIFGSYPTALPSTKILTTNATSCPMATNQTNSAPTRSHIQRSS
jgi:hypothetical protein